MRSDPPLWAYESPYGGSLVFARVCPTCSRFVSPDPRVVFRESMDGAYDFQPNATCSKHGRVTMPFEGDL